jgi:hypothetical protein
MAENTQEPQAQPEATSAAVSPQEIEEGKAFAILSYVLSFVLLSPEVFVSCEHFRPPVQ